MKVLLVLFFALIPTLFRAYDIEDRFADNIGSTGESFIAVIRNDLPVVAVILALLLTVAVVRRPLVAFIFFAVAAALHFFLVIDFVLFDEFRARLTLTDVLRYGSYTPEYIADLDLEFMSGFLFGAAIWAVINYLLWAFLRRRSMTIPAASIAILLLGAVGFGSWVTRDTGYVHYRLHQNLFSYNATVASEFRDYSNSFAASVTNPFTQTCRSAPPLSGPLIIYMVESLSSYQSAFFSGLNDWTPQIDRLAAENLAFTDFYANGFTTEDGQLSLLTGQIPIYPPNTLSRGGSTEFAGYWTPERSLVSVLKEKGYETHFMTTSDLGFSSTGAWMTSIGFDNVEGSTAPFYDDWPRFHFDSAPDKALVQRVIDVVDASDKRTFIFVKSVSSHHPFVHPETGDASVEQVFRYVDEQIGVLHSALEDRGFFETGHLVIVGDHRAMRPLQGEEVALFGFEKAATQTPAVVIGNRLASAPRAIDAPFSQVDIGSGFIGLAEGEVCNSAVQGAMFGADPVPAQYILHRRGDQRNQLSVFSDARVGVVTLQGDDTALEGRAFSQEESNQLVDYVNYMRVQARDADAAFRANGGERHSQ